MLIEKEETLSRKLTLLGNCNTALMFGTQLLSKLNILGRVERTEKVMFNSKVAIVKTNENLLSRLARNGLVGAEWAELNLVLIFKDVGTKVLHEKKQIPFLEYLTMKAARRSDEGEYVWLEFDTSSLDYNLLVKVRDGDIVNSAGFKEVIEKEISFNTLLDQYLLDLINTNKNILRSKFAAEFYIDPNDYFSGTNQYNIHRHRFQAAKIISLEGVFKIIDEIYD
jgi:hypothetical protein